jgi:hypothetical protein
MPARDIARYGEFFDILLTFYQSFFWPLSDELDGDDCLGLLPHKFLDVEGRTGTCDRLVVELVWPLLTVRLGCVLEVVVLALGVEVDEGETVLLLDGTVCGWAACCLLCASWTCCSILV